MDAWNTICFPFGVFSRPILRGELPPPTDYKPLLDLDVSEVYFQSLLKGQKIAEDFELLMISSNNSKDATVFYLCFF